MCVLSMVVGSLPQLYRNAFCHQELHLYVDVLDMANIEGLDVSLSLHGIYINLLATDFFFKF